MKKQILIVGTTLALFIGGTTFTSCENTKEGSNHSEKMEMKGHQHSQGEEHAEEMAHSDFQCPMKCEGDKTYEEAGECPKCGMNLKKQ